PASLKKNVLKAIQQDDKPTKQVRHISWRWFFAAAFILAGILTFALWQPEKESLSQGAIKEAKLPNIHQKDKQLENTHISILPPMPKKILAKRHHPQKMKKTIDKSLTNKEIIPVNNIDDKEEISPILSNDIPIVEKPQSTFTAYERQLLENLEKNRYLVRACLAEELFQASVKQSKIAEIRNSYLQDALQLYENINEQIQEDIENLGKDKEENTQQV
ncbi:MAG: hypothetical protein II011_06920, partial [Prevotella sp.]|nr:hypothetical protein [Prevotella sp.]MBQ1800467.1 hypothetical protein [Prevotella sp.]